MQSILLIEDDPMIAQPLLRALSQAGYQVEHATDGEEGLATALTGRAELVILDIMLPKMDGWALCQALRQQSTVPILMLTALGEEIDRVLGLEMGADDYLTKPFSTRELLARIRALLRRVQLERQPPPGIELQRGALRLNLNTRQAYKGATPLSLRYKEFELLSLLMSREGEVVTRAELFDEVWGTDWLGDTRTLDVHVRWLREKVEENPSQPRYIQTVRGVGYRLVAPDGTP